MLVGGEMLLLPVAFFLSNVIMMHYFTLCETCKRANECTPLVSIYLQKEQIRVPAVYAICQYARITLNTAQTSTVCYSQVNNTYQHCIIIHSSSQEQTLASDREPFWWKKGICKLV